MFCEGVFSKFDDIKITYQFGYSKSPNYKKATRLCMQFPNHSLVEYKQEVNQCTVTLDDYCRYKKTIDELLAYISNWKSHKIYVNDIIVNNYEYRDLQWEIELDLKSRNNKKNWFRLKLLQGEVTIENLPFPVVYYPKLYGTFFAFAKDEHSIPSLCQCSYDIVKILFSETKDKLSFFAEKDFPEVILETVKDKNNPLSSIPFENNLCHRCNLAQPSSPYCHKMYGGKFMQTYGWYVNQNKYKLQACINSMKNTSVESPFLETLSKAFILAEKYNNEYEELSNKEVAKYGSLYFITDEMEDLKKLYIQQLKVMNRIYEDYTRQEFGFRKIGDRWVNETILYQIICKIFKGETIFRHYRPHWLNGLELDIFIPKHNIAFEYQGQQHFHPVKAWGGYPALKKLQERDKKKLEICTNLGVNLFLISYQERLSEEYILKLLNK